MIRILVVVVIVTIILMIDMIGVIHVIIYDEMSDRFQVKYFTNDENRKDKIPQTIENWRKEFSEYEVVL